MTKSVVLGVGMTKFTRHLDKSFKELSNQAIESALKSAGIERGEIGAAFVSNVMAGAIWGQDSVRGQVFLNDSGLAGIPIYNIENACASGSSSLALAQMAIESGQHEIVLALGVEKMYHKEKERSFKAFLGATDIENYPKALGARKLAASQSVFMNLYAGEARSHMEQFGTSIESLAKIAVKNSENGSFNPYAQYQKANDLETVLNSRMITDPLRLLMCSPLSDGAACVILCSEAYAKKLTRDPIYLKSSVVLSGSESEVETVTKAARLAYQKANLGPDEIDVFEVHDAAVSGELWAYEQLELCAPGEGARLIEDGVTKITGSMPVNPSGGLLSRGHPVGATGLAQIAEIFWQLKKQSNQNVVQEVNNGLTHNVGGFINNDNAAVAITIIGR